jgi:hypothetical protein
MKSARVSLHPRVLGFGLLQDGDVGVGVFYVVQQSSQLLFARKTVLKCGLMTDLGALPGVNYSFASWISPGGLVAGFSQNGEIDPLLGAPEINAVLWKDGEIVNLGTIEGGYESKEEIPVVPWWT